MKAAFVFCAMTTGTHAAHRHGWLDSFAIGIAGVCAVHCLLLPLILVLVPIFSTSFFAHQMFHIWMLCLVLPTTGLAVFTGCRKHKDKWVAGLSALGVACLLVVILVERSFHATDENLEIHAGHEHVHGHDHAHAAESHGDAAMHSLGALPWINTLGGLLIASAHVRNFRLCRKSDCQHD